MKHNLLKSVILSVILLMGVSNAWASNGNEGTSITVYTSGELFASAWDTSKSYIKIHVRRGTDDWMNYATMTETGNTYNGKKIYSYTFKEKWDGAQIYFEHWKTGSGSRISEYGTDWANTSTLNGKLYLGYMDNGHRWATLCYDATIYFLKNGKASSWTTPKAHAWNEGYSSVTTTWPGTTMTNTQKTYDGNPIYSVTFSNPPYSKVIFNQGNNTNQSGEQAIPDHEGKIFDYDANKWIDYTYDVTVTFIANGGTGNDYTQTVKYNTATALTANKFTRTGYSFNGWKTEANSGTSYADKANVTFQDNTALYAQWTPAKYTITYKDQGGSNFSGTNKADLPAQHTYGTATTLVNGVKTGYTFGGWHTDQECTNKVTSLGATAYTANITLYAKWTANKYIVTLDNQSATTAGTTSVQATYGSAMPSATMPQKTGYTFGGYYTAINGGGTKYYDANGSSAKNWDKTAETILYAKWTATDYTITYNTNGGNSIAQKTYTIETATFDLPTPTRTGYTFAGWYDNANLTGNKVTQVAKGSTGNKTFYADWIINQYTLTFGAAEGGSVTATVGGNPISSPAALNYNTQVVLTAAPADGNIFTQWVNQNDELVSAANPYTFTLQESKTLKAQFTQATIVYLKPEDYWKSDNACFGIYAKKGSTEQKIEMVSIDCENAYYSATVPVGYSEFKYVRLNPNNKNQVWNETPYFSASNAKGKYYVTPRIYFKPSGNWKLDNARFAAYFFKSENNSENTWRDLKKTENDLYTCNIPGGYDMVIFCRMNPKNPDNRWNKDDDTEENKPKWNQTGDLSINPEHNNKGNCFEMTGKEWEVSGSWSTYWETSTTYTVTLKSSSYGLYNVSINGQTHHSNYKTDVVVENVPLGAQVEVYNVMPHNPKVYNEDIIVKRSSNASYERYTNNKTFTVCGNTTIAEDFVTKEAHTLYLGVPDALITATTQWNLQKFIWTKNGSGDQPLIESTQSFKIGTVTYYEITIPAGYNKFCFQSKQQAGSGPTECQSIWFYRSIPTNNVNCFTLKNEKDGSGYYKGDWTQLPAANGDFRVLYVEQQVEQSGWKTVINNTYQHSSDIIKKRTATGTDIVSLHINYDETKHPRIILQQMSSGEWVDVEGQARMAVGPLTATADKAMAPGRRNAAGEGLLTYDDGIEEIKQDKQDGYAGRVWNFTVQQTVDNGNVTAKLLLENLEPYSGDYYIRTDNAEGGWLCYNQPNNVMPYSEYSLKHSGYSHYFCKWVETKPNTKFVVANEYGAAISDTIVADDFTDVNGTLTAHANVRWMWNEYTNIGSRAYIAGSTQEDFLKVFYEDSKSKKFKDKGEWVYEIDLTDVEVGKKLTSIIAEYKGTEQQLLEKTHYDAGGVVMLASTGVARSTYTVRVVYDFKINQTLLYLLPTDQPVSTSIDVIIERINQDEEGQATQVAATITPADKEKGLTVYGVITLTKDHITDSKKSEQEALTYWISFPFDVNIADISGFGEHGKDWILRKYNGAKRAEKGWFLDTPTFWERISEGTLEANTGYVLALHTRMLNESCPLYDNTSTLKLYFPSKDKITEDITADLIHTECSIPEHICTIEFPRDRRDADSNWNFIGVPSFANKNNKNSNLNYFYEYNFATDTYSAEKNVGPTTFRSMHAYMVQFGGTIDWSSIADNNAQQLAAKKNASAEDNYELRLELQQNGAKADQTFVELQEEGATEMFDMNIDLAKMFNAGANIYTIIGESKTEAAANVLPIANTTIPVGVQIATAGEYTFAMPDGTDGVVVELIDYEYNTRTNLLFSEYTVNLPAGTNDTRFALSVKPDKTATSMENITTPSDGELRKFIIDGVLYMQKDGVLYDAQGKLVR